MVFLGGWVFLMSEVAAAREQGGRGVAPYEASMKRESNSNLSVSEVYSTACALLVILKNSCGKRHCQKGFDLILFSYRCLQLRTTCSRGSLRREAYLCAEIKCGEWAKKKKNCFSKKWEALVYMEN